MWIDKLFSERDDIVRLGLTTWSEIPNENFQKNLVLLMKTTEARIVAGEYYDSVSYGVLKEEWEIIKNCSSNEHLTSNTDIQIVVLSLQ